MEINPHTEVPKSIFIEENIKKTLFNSAMKGNWDEVINTYQHKETGYIAHTAKITKSEDTAVHIAITGGLEEVVKRLVSSASTTPGSLAIKNELGNTPLHLAASLGNVRMCKCIAEKDSKLIGKRNKDSETPLFLAVHHGRKAAFLCLDSFCKNEDFRYGYSRKNDGETILHSAVSGEYFDIAFQIIHLYPELLNSVNEHGFSPLHLLASKPSAFRSGSHIRGFGKLIYHCIFVDELKLESNCPTLSQELRYGDNKTYPENYQTCVSFALLLRSIMGYNTVRNRRLPDAEYPRVQKPIHKQGEQCIGSSKKWNNQQANAEQQQTDHKQGISNAQGHQLFPPNYLTWFHGLKFLSKALLVILGLGSAEIVKLRQKKEKHIWSVQIMEKLLEHASSYEYEDNGRRPHHLAPQRDGETTPYALFYGDDVPLNPENLIEPPKVHDDHNPSLPADNSSNSNQDNDEVLSKGTKENGTKEKGLDMEKRETPILIAAKKGITEMVERILKLSPMAIHDMNNEKRNIVLLAVENRQPRVYKFLLDRQIMKEATFRQRDKDGNSALHLAAMLGNHRAWLIPGAALQMQWEIKWYEFVKNSMPLHFFPRYNKTGQTPRDIFTETHKDLVKEGGEWLTSTSESCSVVAALIATVAFATSSTVPGGMKSDSGKPILENQPAFSIFAISSLIALCFSVTSVVMFLAILTSRYQAKDFGKDLPNKLLAGLTSLFVSIASMLVSFCAGHFFVLKDKLKYAAFPVYTVTCLPVTLFAVAQFPLYFDLIWATFKKVPQRSYK